MSPTTRLDTLARASTTSDSRVVARDRSLIFSRVPFRLESPLARSFAHRRDDDDASRHRASVRGVSTRDDDDDSTRDDDDDDDARGWIDARGDDT